MHETTSNRIKQVEEWIEFHKRNEAWFNERGKKTHANRSKRKREAFEKELKLLKKPDLTEWCEYVTGEVLYE